MSKKKKNNNPPKNLALTEEEQKRLDAGGSVVASLSGKLHSAWREDFREVLFALGADVATPEDLGPLGDGQKHLPAIKRRVSLGLEYTVSDSDSATELGGPPVSYEHGIDSVLSIARMLLPRHFIQGLKRHEHAYDVEFLRHQIDGCIIALVARGKMQHAADLMRLAGCVMAIDRSEIGASAEEFREGSSNQHSDDFNKLKVLLALDVCLQRGEIPTKGRLRTEFFATDPSNFSVMLEGMQIRDLIPNEPPGRKPKGYKGSGSFPATIWSGLDEELREHRESMGTSRSLGEAGEECDGASGTDSHPQRSTSDPAMIDRDIRLVRENLGAVYHLLLIEFDMAELENADDLRKFEDRLSERGLRLS